MAYLATRGHSPWGLDLRMDGLRLGGATPLESLDERTSWAGRSASLTSEHHTLGLLCRGNAQWLAGGARRTEIAPVGAPCRAVVVACSDQSPAPEVVFDVRFGDLLVAQTPGQLIDDSVAATVLLGVHTMEIGLVVVLAHEACAVLDQCCSGLPTTALARLTARALDEARGPDRAAARALAQAQQLRHLIGPHAMVAPAVLRQSGRVELVE